MRQFEINMATRMMRAGNEFSETNQKLQKAVWSFIEWFFDRITECQLPTTADFGWSIKRMSPKQIRLSFRTDKYGWYSITTNSSEPQMNAVVLCCRTLAGTEGEHLLTWIEKQIREREQMLTVLQTTMQTLRPADNTAVKE